MKILIIIVLLIIFLPPSDCFNVNNMPDPPGERDEKFEWKKR